MSNVKLIPEAKDDLLDLDRSTQVLVAKALKKLETDPEQRGAPLGSRKSGNLTNFRKLVVGNRAYRIIYRVESDGTIAVVWVIGKRADDECYAIAMSRLQLYSGNEELKEGLLNLLEKAWDAV